MGTPTSLSDAIAFAVTPSPTDTSIQMTGGVATLDGRSTAQRSKPVECMRRSIANHSGTVYDPFVGNHMVLRTIGVDVGHLVRR